MRAVFRDFELDPQTSVVALCEFYDLPQPADATLALGDWIAAALRRPPVAGDTLRLGSATLVVRELRDGVITRIGLGLPK